MPTMTKESAWMGLETYAKSLLEEMEKTGSVDKLEDEAMTEIDVLVNQIHRFKEALWNLRPYEEEDDDHENPE